MDKFIDKNGKTVLQINDEGEEEINTLRFKDGILVISRTSEEEGHFHEFDPTDLTKGTETTDGHKHGISDKQIEPAKDGHTHALPSGV